MRIAICQMDIVWENKQENYQKASRFIEEASRCKSDLILFPEMSFTGFSMCIDITKEQHEESLEYIKKQAIQHKIAIGFGWVKAYGEKAQNHYTVVNKRGELVNDYIKLHSFSYAGEDQFFTAGDQVKQCEIEGWGMSTFICYDLRFPEIFQAISNTVGIIVVAANWPAARAEHWKTLLRARAIENQLYIIGVNCVGWQNGQHYSGNSCMITPIGDIVASLSNKEGLIIEDIEDCIKEVRQAFQQKKDRRNALYKTIL